MGWGLLQTCLKKKQSRAISDRSSRARGQRLNSRARRERPEISHESRLSSHKCNRTVPLPHQAEHLHLPWHHPLGRRPKYGTAASRRPSEVCCFCPVSGARIQRFPYRFFRVGSWKEKVHPHLIALSLSLSVKENGKRDCVFTRIRSISAAATCPLKRLRGFGTQPVSFTTERSASCA